MIDVSYYGNVVRFKKGTLDMYVVLIIWISVRWDEELTDHGDVVECAEGGVKSIYLYSKIRNYTYLMPIRF